MNENIVEIEVLELAGALKINGKKVLPGEKAELLESEALLLEKEGLLKILGTAEEKAPETIVAPTTTTEGETLQTEEKASVPVIEPNKTEEKTAENTEEKVVDPADIEEEVERLVKDYTFKDLAEHAKSLGITKVVGISAKDLAKNIVEKSIETQE